MEKICVQDQVIQDLHDRKKVGLNNYGTLLYPFNGRNALVDLYEELLDACCYIKQFLIEDELSGPTADLDAEALPAKYPIHPETRSDDWPDVRWKWRGFYPGEEVEEAEDGDEK